MSYQLVYDIVKIAPNTFIVMLVCFFFFIKNKIDRLYHFFLKKNSSLAKKPK